MTRSLGKCSHVKWNFVPFFGNPVFFLWNVWSFQSQLQAVITVSLVVPWWELSRCLGNTGRHANITNIVQLPSQQGGKLSSPNALPFLGAGLQRGALPAYHKETLPTSHSVQKQEQCDETLLRLRGTCSLNEAFNQTRGLWAVGMFLFLIREPWGAFPVPLPKMNLQWVYWCSTKASTAQSRLQQHCFTGWELCKPK